MKKKSKKTDLFSGFLRIWMVLLPSNPQSKKRKTKKQKSGKKKKPLFIPFFKQGNKLLKDVTASVQKTAEFIRQEKWARPVIILTGIAIIIFIIFINAKPVGISLNNKNQSSASKINRAVSSASISPEEVVFFGKVSFIQGNVRYLAPGETNWKDLKEGQPLFRNSVVKSEKYSEAEVTLADDSVIKVMDNTSLRIVRAPDISNSRPAAVNLQKGRIYYQGKVGSPGMNTTAGAATVVAKGSQFSLDNSDGTVKVAVIEGVAIVNSKGATMPMKKNQGFVGKPGDTAPSVFDLPSVPQPMRLRSH